MYLKTYCCEINNKVSVFRNMKYSQLNFCLRVRAS